MKVVRTYSRWPLIDLVNALVPYKGKTKSSHFDKSRLHMIFLAIAKFKWYVVLEFEVDISLSKVALIENLISCVDLDLILCSLLGDEDQADADVPPWVRLIEIEWSCSDVLIYVNKPSTSISRVGISLEMNVVLRSCNLVSDEFFPRIMKVFAVMAYVRKLRVEEDIMSSRVEYSLCDLDITLFCAETM